MVMMTTIFMIILFLILLVFGSSRLHISKAGTTINCFTDRPSSVTGFNCSGEDGLPADTMKYPFWPMEAADGDDQISSTRAEICGYPGFGYSCTPYNYEDGSGSYLRPTLNISNDMYYVDIVDTTNRRIRIVNRDLFFNAESRRCPRPRLNFTLDDDQLMKAGSLSKDWNSDTNLYIFYNCSVPPPPGSYNTTKDRTHPACLQVNHNNHSYAFFHEEIHDDRVNSGQPLLSKWSDNGSSNCDEIVILPVVKYLSNTDDYLDTLRAGFQLYWSTPIGDDSKCFNCELTKGLCIYSNQNGSYLNCSCPPGTKLRTDDGGPSLCLPEYGPSPSPSPSPTPNDKIPENIIDSATTHHGIGVFAGIGGLIILVILFSFIYLKIQRNRRETSSTTTNVELFLESYGCLSLQRYKYSQIKKITNSFTEKLGQGGFGTVYKGALTDGRYVAVKVLVSDPTKKTSGEDIINEVATIGRTNHVNVVALIGFCSSGSRRALVYEFMANGSLEKFIYAKNERGTDDSSTVVAGTIDNNGVKHPLGWEKLYQISLGIARGLEYLHRGCNTRILHFDIKPHNILLDENFCPKISDFGLAKLCPTRDSVVSMLTVGRGTIGYIAPEVTCRNIGRVSHKSDVYSYGMMVLEMVGGRKNIDPFVENTSEIYFPHWIYNRLEEQGDKIRDLLKVQEVVEEDLARKMIMVGLWCIQTNPADRPSMNEVVDMLEGSIDNLQTPPKPFVDSSSSSSPPPPPRS